MNTTHAFVEIIVSGVLALAAVMLLAAGLLGVDGVPLLLAGPEYLTAAVLAVIAYSLGVGFDRLWDLCAAPLDRKIRFRHFATDEEVREVRTRIFAESEKIGAFLDYIRTRMRIARNCMFAFPLLAISLLFALQRLSLMSDAKHPVAISVLVATLGLLSLFAYTNLVNSYYKQLRLAAKHVLKMPLKDTRKG